MLINHLTFLSLETNTWGGKGGKVYLGFSPRLTGFIALSLRQDRQDRTPGWWEPGKGGTYLTLARKGKEKKMLEGRLETRCKLWGGDLLSPVR